MSDPKDNEQNEHTKAHNEGQEAGANMDMVGRAVHAIIGPFVNDDDYNDGVDNGLNNQSKGTCFITTACVEAAKLPDSCHELTVLRHFRDCYVAHRPHGAAMLAEYYATAPRIVECIQRSPQRAAVLDTVFSDVRRAVSLIESGRQESALAVYAAMFTRLQKEFLEQ